MATAREDIRDLIATATLETARAWGVSITLSHRSASNVTLYAIKSADSTEGDDSGGSFSELRRVTFAIPLQSNFAITSDETEPVSLQDKIGYKAREYFVTGVTSDSLGAVYRVEVEETKRLFQGVN